MSFITYEEFLDMTKTAGYSLTNDHEAESRKAYETFVQNIDSTVCDALFHGILNADRIGRTELDQRDAKLIDELIIIKE